LKHLGKGIGVEGRGEHRRRRGGGGGGERQEKEKKETKRRRNVSDSNMGYNYFNEALPD
jgi:hypothetical protein